MKFEITIVHQAEAKIVIEDPSGDRPEFDTLESAREYGSLIGIDESRFRIKVSLQGKEAEGPNLVDAITRLMLEFGWRIGAVHDVTHDSTFPSLGKALQN
ncbi:MAG: hypothetical protein LIP09_09085 [Bacteroidales bacterium]|nr:hypothetical protein [Bacteroidales bacterium]